MNQTPIRRHSARCVARIGPRIRPRIGASRNRNTRGRALTAATLTFFIGALGLVSPAAHAQTTVRIDASTIERPAIAPGDDASRLISAFVDRHASALRSGDAAEAARAIAQVLQPLDNADASVSFRQAYTAALSALLDEMADDRDHTWRRLSALRLAGRLATEPSATFVERSLASDTEADRLFAIVAVEMIFDAAAGASPAVTPATLLRLIDRFDTALQEDDDAMRLDARVRALIAAADVPASRLPGVADAAKTVLAERLAAVLRDQPVSDADPAALRAVLRSAAAISDRIRIPGQATPEFAITAAAFAGDMIAYTLERSAEGSLVTGDEDAFDTLFVGVADNLARFADQRYAEARSTSPVFDRVSPLRDAVVSGDRSGFDANGIRLIQLLTERPFSLPASRFER
ncbi:MAG: hypothetical protein AAF235_05235 [Planctomycetota bacterium]